MRQKTKHVIVPPGRLLVLGATLMGLFVRLSFITKSSIWHDEGFSIFLAQRTTAQIWAGSARDVHPPLYYLVLHFWMMAFGTSELAIRSLSMVAGVAIIPLGYLVVKRMAGNRAAVLASFVLALAPFLIRYSQEARMYGLLGLLLLTALYAVMRIVEDPKQLWPYILYTAMITLGLYTHYFAVLAIVAFWVYFIVLQNPKQWRLNATILLSLKWWLANLAALGLFLPWAPTALAQIRRGQGLGWLPKASIHSFHDAVWQFFTFTDARQIVMIFYWIVPILIIAAAIYLIITDRTKEKYARLLVSYSFVPIALALLVSIQKPIFHERYFAFASIGIFMLVAIALSRLAGKRRWLFVVFTVGIISLECIGVRNVYSQSNHQVRTTMAELNSQYQPNDVLLAGELYTYFDGSYYNKTGQKMLLYTKNNDQINGYGESGLLYDKNVYIDSYSQIPVGARVWLIGKTLDRAYYDQIPTSWQLLQQYTAGYSEVRLYQVK